MTLHDTEEFDNDLRGGTNENLALSTPLSIDNVFLRDAFRRMNVNSPSKFYQAVILLVR